MSITDYLRAQLASRLADAAEELNPRPPALPPDEARTRCARALMRIIDGVSGMEIAPSDVIEAARLLHEMGALDETEDA